VANLVHAAGPALSVAQLALPAGDHAASAGLADGAGAQCSHGLRLAFSGTTSGSIAVWDLSLEQPTVDDELVQVSLHACNCSGRLSFRGRLKQPSPRQSIGQLPAASQLITYPFGQQSCHALH